MSKRVLAFLWNHFPFLRRRLPVAVECHKCGVLVHGREQIEKWMVSWRYCEECASEYMDAILTDRDLSPSRKAKLMLSVFPMLDWDKVLANTPTRAYDADTLFMKSVKREVKK